MEHQWQIISSVKYYNIPYEIVRCEVCGVTGKRYQLNEAVTYDRQYMAKKYRACRHKEQPFEQESL